MEALLVLLIVVGFVAWGLQTALHESYEDGRQAGMSEAWDITFNLSREYGDSEKYSESRALLAACNKISSRRKLHLFK